MHAALAAPPRPKAVRVAALAAASAAATLSFVAPAHATTVVSAACPTPGQPTVTARAYHLPAHPENWTTLTVEDVATGAQIHAARLEVDDGDETFTVPLPPTDEARQVRVTFRSTEEDLPKREPWTNAKVVTVPACPAPTPPPPPTPPAPPAPSAPPVIVEVPVDRPVPGPVRVVRRCPVEGTTMFGFHTQGSTILRARLELRQGGRWVPADSPKIRRYENVVRYYRTDVRGLPNRFKLRWVVTRRLDNGEVRRSVLVRTDSRRDCDRSHWTDPA